jgi:hypothetical protein
MSESEKIETFELETISNRSTGVLAVKDFGKTLDTAKRIIEQYPVPTIENDAQKKDAKAVRATLNKIVKAIDRKRIDTVNDYTTEFEDSCNQIKTLFDERQAEFGKAISEYEDSQKTVIGAATDIKKFTATIKFTDGTLIEKLKNFCTKHGCELTIK